jgi:hypothetical protein
MVLPYDNMDYGVDEVGARNITELTDVELTNLANGEILKYNSTNLKWENQPDSAGGGSLDALTDTNISSLINGQFLQYNSSNSKWENSTLTFTDTDNLVDLTDTNISSVANNELLKYNSSSSKWENAPVLINEIQDINIVSLQDGEVLKYNSTSGKWENQDNTDTLNELTDVTLTGSTNNQVLKYNGSIWVNNFVNLTELADTNITTLNNGDILRYNSTSTKWETNTFNINDLDDVNITSLQNNEILKYNSTSGKWENSNRIDTLDELGDVTLTSVTTGDLLRYNGSNFVNTKIALDNDFTNVNFTSLTNGDLIKYNGSNFINFAPTYLDGAGIPDNYLIKVVSGATTRTTFIETSTIDVGTSLKTYIPTTPGLGILGGSIETEFFDTTKTRMHLTSTGIAIGGGITVTSDGKVGIGIVAPEEDLEVDGSIQIDSANVARLKFQKSGASPHALGEIDGEVDGTNGGDLQFYTKVDGASLTEKLRINNQGAIGIEGANFGTSGQVLTSNDSGSAVSWEDQTDTTYTAGTGVSISPSNEISIGQSVATTVTPTFNGLEAGSGTVVSARMKFNFWDPPSADYDACRMNHHLVTQGSGKDLGANNINRAFRTIYYSGNLSSVSDNRFKHNESVIRNALQVMRLLSPKIYDKTLSALTPEYNGDLSDYEHWKEAGFISQEVEQIPELQFAVKSGMPLDDGYIPKFLGYNNLFVYNIAALKELDTLVQQQQVVIQNLITRIEALESK